MYYRKYLAAVIAFVLAFSVPALGREHWALRFMTQLDGIRQTADQTTELHGSYDSIDLDNLIDEVEFYLLLGNGASGVNSVTEQGKIMREQAFGAIAAHIRPGQVGELRFSDTEDISEQYYTDIQKLVAAGVIDGYPDGSLKPRRWLTRGEAYKLVAQLRAYLAEQEPDSEDKNAEGNRGSAADDTRPDTNRDTSRSDTTPQRAVSQGTAPRLASSPQSVTDTVHGTPRGTDSGAGSPTLELSAAMGSMFRSIDLYVSAADDADNPEVYYSVVETGTAAPNALELLAGTRGLAGRWVNASNRLEKSVTLSVSGWNGLIDGYRYDVYMVARDSGGRLSPVVCAEGIMAAPFHAVNLSDGTFTLKALGVDEIQKLYPDIAANAKGNPKQIYQTARQLENIQRLADLYEDTGGRHGSREFLTSGEFTYVLDSDFDLKYYMAQGLETGWQPIGGEHAAFSGKIDGQNYTVTNLYIDRDDSLRSSSLRYFGLFGRLSGAVVRNLRIDSPVILAKNLDTNDRSAAVGALAGESVNSVIDNINVASPQITAYSGGDSGRLSVGGAAGNAVNTDLSEITVTGADLRNYKSVDKAYVSADVIGGVVGRFFAGSGETEVFGDLFVSGNIAGGGKAAGGVSGTMDVVNGTTVYAINIDSLARVRGSALFAGGVAGNVGYEQLISGDASVTFENCYASGVVEAAECAGGLFGKVNSAEIGSFVVKASASEADVVAVSDYGVMGGFVGEVYSGSFEECHSVGSGITSLGDNAGGFAGIINGKTDFFGCVVNRNIQARKNAGGFVGAQTGGSARFYSCKITSNVSGQESIGSFAGSLTADKTGIELVDCSIQGKVTGGQMVGGFQ